MNILLIAENWPPRVGGIEKYLTNIALELQKKGDAVTVIAPSTDKSRKQEAGIKVVRKKFFWPLIKPSWLPLYWQTRRIIKQERIDVVLCGKGLFEGLLGHYLKKKLGVPYVVFTYAMEIEKWTQEHNTRRKLENAISTADKIMYINSVTRKKLEGLGASSEQLQRVYPGVEEKFFAHDNERTPQSFSEVGSRVLRKHGIAKPYILCVARLIPRKGIDNLIEAFSQLDQTKHGNVELVIAGSGPEAERLQQLSARLFIQPRFLGFVPDEDLPALFANATLFALTPTNIDGDFEGFGIVYLEAGAAGVPVLGTKSGGAEEAVIHKETGLLVEADNTQELKEALEYLLNNPDDAKRMGHTGKKRARDEFNWGKQTSALRDALENIVSNT